MDIYIQNMMFEECVEDGKDSLRHKYIEKYRLLR